MKTQTNGALNPLRKYVDLKVQLLKNPSFQQMYSKWRQMFHNISLLYIFVAYMFPQKVGINNEDAFWPEIATQTIMYLVFFQQMHSTLLFCLAAKHPKD